MLNKQRGILDLDKEAIYSDNKIVINFNVLNCVVQKLLEK